MSISLQVNGVHKEWSAAPGDTLLQVLRREGYFGAKFGGCEKGECGACTVLLDGKPVNSCGMLAAQADGHRVETIENTGQHPEQGWKKTEGLSVIQQAFVEIGAIQCGYCTPAMVLAAQTLLANNPHPDEWQVRESLSGILCRCTGYQKPVQAILRAAAILRGESVLPISGTPVAGETVPGSDPAPAGLFGEGDEPGGGAQGSEIPVQTGGDNTPRALSAKTRVMPQMWTTPEMAARTTVGRPEKKVDAVKLVQGKPAFTDDIELRNMLVAKVLHSPLAHAMIRRIDPSRARALPGVAAVLTYQDIPRVVYSTAGQSDPIPGPLDSFSLDQKVRFVGDRVA
ncbi:MAG: xanthine dehydrogenase, partial [Chloroflexi bacterium]